MINFQFWVYKKLLVLREGMKDFGKDLSIDQKLEQYKQLAIEYFKYANSLGGTCEGDNNTCSFLYLHSVELLLKWKIIEKYKSIALDVEKSHNFKVLLDKLGFSLDKFQDLIDADPNRVRFRYPGDKYSNRISSFGKIKDQVLLLWNVLNG